MASRRSALGGVKAELVEGYSLEGHSREHVVGSFYGSMPLVVDGCHILTHAAAMLIAALAHLCARRHARFTSGTGKPGDLAAFASAIVLALVPLLIGWEGLLRLRAPVPIDFAQAIGVAVPGLAVNLASAWLLQGALAMTWSRARPPWRHNMRAAYMHVLADA